MNRFVYILTGAVVGGAIGYVIGDYVAYKIWEKETLSRELSPEEAEKPEDDISLPEKPRNHEEIKASLKSSRTVNYGGYFQPKPPAEEILKAHSPAKNKEASPVRVLNQIDYEDSNWDKRVVLYYTGNNSFYNADGDLTDCNEDIKILEEDLGSEISQTFGHLSGDPDVLYIRKESGENTIDYEFIRVDDIPIKKQNQESSNLISDERQSASSVEKPKKQRKPKSIPVDVDDED